MTEREARRILNTARRVFRRVAQHPIGQTGDGRPIPSGVEELATLLPRLRLRPEDVAAFIRRLEVEPEAEEKPRSGQSMPW